MELKIIFPLSLSSVSKFLTIISSLSFPKVHCKTFFPSLKPHSAQTLSPSEPYLMPQLELTIPSSRSPLSSLVPLLSHLHSALGKCYYLCSWLLILWAPSGRRVELGQSPKHGGQLFNVHQVKSGFSRPGGSFLSSSRAAVIYRCVHSDVGKLQQNPELQISVLPVTSQVTSLGKPLNSLNLCVLSTKWEECSLCCEAK